MADPAREVEKLRDELRRHEHRYYVLNDPEISDEQYDKLLKRLEALESENPGLRSPDSPTVRVGGAPSSEFKPIRHGVPMLSLDNTYNAEEVTAWHERAVKGLKTEPEAYVVEPKIDGVSCALVYEDGALKTAATRGDGETGEDITANARTIRQIPLRLRGAKVPASLEVRGEVYMDRETFQAVNRAERKAGREPFVNPRNCTSGSLRQKDPKVTASRRLKFFAHSQSRIDGVDAPATHWDFLESCVALGFSVASQRKRCKSIEEVIAFYKKFQEVIPRLPFDVDGLVVKIDSHAQQRKLGFTAKSPRWAIAFKYPGQQAVTTLNGVTYSVGRTGTITPVADLEPVFCGGVTISSASLHNFEEIQRLGVRIGDRVVIERAGEVIPHVVKTVASARTGKEKAIPPPEACPACGGTVEKEEAMVAYRCVNPSCPAQLKRGLLHFASRDGLDIEGMGDVVVEQLVDSGRVKDFADVFSLTKADLLKLELFADKRAENLLAKLGEAKARPLSRLLYALGIRQVGERTARDLAAHFGTLDALSGASAEELEKIPEVGPIVAESVAAFFKQAQVRRLLAKLKTAGLNLKEPERAKPVSTGLTGKTFVFTGELESMTRGQAEEKVRALGAEATSSVSKKTSYVVIGKEPGSKADKARKLGVATLDESAFLKLLGQ